jgi:hypothetical protein
MAEQPTIYKATQASKDIVGRNAEQASTSDNTAFISNIDLIN